MSSRLFQKIREEHGMAYSVYSYPTSYADTGYFTLYAGTGEKQAAKVTELMLEEIAGIRKHGITQAEFDRSKQQLKGSYVLGMESASAHMNAIGKSALLMQEEYDLETTLNRIECVTIEDVKRMIPMTFTAGKMTLASVGRLGSLQETLRKQVETWWSKRTR